MTPSDPLEITSLFSFSALRISLRRKDQTGASIERKHCTGFLWKGGDELYLITNWHCVTGWDPVAWKAIDEKNCFEPQTVATQITLSGEVEKNAAGEEVFATVRKEISVDLRKEGRPVWLEHPKFGCKVDVVAIPLGPGPGGLRSAPINSFDYKDLAASVGDEAFVRGYPMASTGNPFPIWKRASIAYEPHADVGDLPKMLLDTATRPGMSGSPVLLMHRGLFQERGSPHVLGSAKAFLGVSPAAWEI